MPAGSASQVPRAEVKAGMEGGSCASDSEPQRPYQQSSCMVVQSLARQLPALQALRCKKAM